jgi:hypothetical protein
MYVCVYVCISYVCIDFEVIDACYVCVCMYVCHEQEDIYSRPAYVMYVCMGVYVYACVIYGKIVQFRLAGCMHMSRMCMCISCLYVCGVCHTLARYRHMPCICVRVLTCVCVSYVLARHRHQPCTYACIFIYVFLCVGVGVMNQRGIDMRHVHMHVSAYMLYVCMHVYICLYVLCRALVMYRHRFHDTYRQGRCRLKHTYLHTYLHVCNIR